MDLLALSFRILKRTGINSCPDMNDIENREATIFEAVDFYYKEHEFPMEYNPEFPSEFTQGDFGLFVDIDKINEYDDYDDNDKIIIEMACFIDSLISYISNIDMNFVFVILNHVYMDKSKFKYNDVTILDQDVIHFLKTTPYLGIVRYVVAYLHRDFMSWYGYSAHCNSIERNHIENKFHIIKLHQEEKGLGDSYLIEKTIEVLNNVSIHAYIGKLCGLNKEELSVYDIIRGRYTDRFIPIYAKAAKEIVSTINSIESKASNRRLLHSEAKKIILNVAEKYRITQEIELGNYSIVVVPKEESIKNMYGLKLYIHEKEIEKCGIVIKRR